MAARWLGYRVAWLYDQGQVPSSESSMIKVLTADLLARIADLGTDILGWAGLVRGRDALRYRTPTTDPCSASSKRARSSQACGARSSPASA